MQVFRFFLVFLAISAFPVMAIADDTISFKGIKFGMKAEKIAELAGGDTEFGCASAINDSDEQPWTYGGIKDWSASCVEDQFDSAKVPGTSGMYRIHTIVHSHNDSMAKSIGYDTYSVEELVEIFSQVFGEFEVESRIMKNGLGQEFEKKVAVSRKDGAFIRIADNLTGSDHQNYIDIDITSVDYLNKKAAWEEEKESEKLRDAKSDF